MTKLTKAEFEALCVKLSTDLENAPKINLGKGVSYVGNVADALGVEDAGAYNQYLITEAYQQHGIKPQTA